MSSLSAHHPCEGISVKTQGVCETFSGSSVSWCHSCVRVLEDTMTTHYVLQSVFFNNTYNQSVCFNFSKNPPIRLHTVWHPRKPAVRRTRPRSLGYVQNDTFAECSGIFGALKLLSLQLPLDEKQHSESSEYSVCVTS